MTYWTEENDILDGGERHIWQRRKTYLTEENDILEGGEWHIGRRRMTYLTEENDILEGGEWHIWQRRKTYLMEENDILTAGEWHIGRRRITTDSFKYFQEITTSVRISMNTLCRLKTNIRSILFYFVCNLYKIVSYLHIQLIQTQHAELKGVSMINLEWPVRIPRRLWTLNLRISILRRKE